ncbi:hypothetical protein ACTXT7_009677 [Hymenolepis weldensis]
MTKKENVDGFTWRKIEEQMRNEKEGGQHRGGRGGNRGGPRGRGGGGGGDQGNNSGPRGGRGGGRDYQSWSRGGGDEGGYRGGGDEGGYRGGGGGDNRGGRGPSRGGGGSRGHPRGGPSGDRGGYDPRRGGGQGLPRGAGGSGARGSTASATFVEMAEPPPVPCEPPPQPFTSFAPTTAVPSEGQSAGVSGKRGKGKRKGRADKAQAVSEEHPETGGLTKDMEAMSIAESEGKISLTLEKYLPNRPSPGTRGTKTSVMVNCWDLEMNSKVLCRYDIQPKNLFTITESGQEKVIKRSEKELQKFMQHVFALTYAKKKNWENVSGVSSCLLDIGVSREFGHATSNPFVCVFLQPPRASRRDFKWLSNAVEFTNVITMGPDVFSDGRRFLYSLTPLDRNKFTIGSPSVLALPDTEGKDLRLKYIIKDVGTISAQPIFDYLTKGPTRTDNLPQDAINMVDNLLRWINKKDYTLIKTGLFERGEERKPQFTIYRGFSISARPQWKLRLNADLTCKAFFPVGNLADILYEIKGNELYNNGRWRGIGEYITNLEVEASHYTNPVYFTLYGPVDADSCKFGERVGRNWTRGNGEFYKSAKKKILCVPALMSTLTTGKKYSKRLKAYGLSPKSAREQMIEDRNISIAAYFQEQYGIELKWPELPCVKTKANREEYVPMELLQTLPFQAPKADVGSVASDMVRIAAVKPEQRFQKLQDFIRTVIKQSPLVKALGLRLVSQDPVTADARILPTPGVTGLGTPVAKGVWRPTPFKVPAFREVKYAIIHFVRAFRGLDKAMGNIDQAGRQLGLQLVFKEERRTIQIADLPGYFKQLREKDVKLAICILPNTGPYSDIKRACEFEQFLVTQCVKEGTLIKANPWPNILQKINGKLGGVNWELNGMQGHWGKETVMVVGADVTHPGPAGINKLRKSVAAVVGSISPNYMKYVAVVKQQDYEVNKETHTAREYIDDMEGIFEQLLQAFYRKNNELPNKILFYRDGVSEGQFSSVVDKELSAMQRACTKLRPGYQPGFTFIIVQKRHHIRFLPTDKSLTNVIPGTIVDTCITHPREFDFYLCSHQGIQGTSKPAHYHIIYDDNNLGANELQLFTFYLCHVYMRCTRSVSYPAPTYYAHLAAFRGRDWMKGVPNPERLLENNQFKLLPEQKDLIGWSSDGAVARGEGETKEVEGSDRVSKGTKGDAVLSTDSAGVADEIGPQVPPRTPPPPPLRGRP